MASKSAVIDTWDVVKQSLCIFGVLHYVIVLALLVLSTEGFRNLDFACLADLCPIFLVKFQREMGKSWR